MNAEQMAVDQCIDAACSHIERGMQTGSDPAWRWSLAEVWFRVAESAIVNGVK